MTEVHACKVTGNSFDEVVEKVFELLGKEEPASDRSKPSDEDLFGLDRKPDDKIARSKPSGKYRWEPSTPGGKPADEATLLTLRRDLTSLREKVLKGAGRRATLLELDYTIDQLDNVLAEM